MNTAIELVASVGWGLLALGAVTHLWHRARLRELLAMHFDRPTPLAVALTAIESGLAVALPVALLSDSPALDWLAAAAALLGLGFVAWIARLLLTDSTLPCACSFSAAPTSIWSLARSACVVPVALFAVLSDPSATAIGDHLAILTVGAGVSAALFVLPEATSWPPASQALLARADAYAPGGTPTSPTQ